jgi:hypothetical protein
MAVHRFHQKQHDGHPGDRQADQCAERDVPVPMVGEKKTGWDAKHLACGEGGLHEAHDAAAQLQRKEIGNDGEHNGADHTAEQAGNDPPQQQHMIVGSDRAKRRSKGKADIKKQKQPLAIELIGKAGRQDAGNSSAECVRRDATPNCAAEILSAGMMMAPSGDMIMKSMMIVNWTRASSATRIDW